MAPTAVDPKVLTQEPGDSLDFYHRQQTVIEGCIALLTKSEQKEQDGYPDSPAAQGVRAAISVLEKQKIRVRKFVSVIESGYAQITLPSVSSHATGYVHDPRLVKISLTALWFGVVMSTLVLLMALGLSIEENTWVIVAMFASIVVISVPFLILNKHNEGRLTAAGIPIWGTKRFYKGAVLARAWESYLAAKNSGLFGNIQIWAPLEAFRKVTFRDLIIFGEVEGQYFLIAQFNPALDLQRV